MNPLWMPKGSVRAIIAILFALAAIGLAFYLVIEARDTDLAKMAVTTVANLAVALGAYYFGRREGDGEHIS